MMLRRGVEEAAPFGRAGPLVEGSGVEVRTQVVQIHGDLPGGVGAVNDAEQPQVVSAAGDLLHGQT